jgi:hypothetical protein
MWKGEIKEFQHPSQACGAFSIASALLVKRFIETLEAKTITEIF